MCFLAMSIAELLAKVRAEAKADGFDTPLLFSGSKELLAAEGMECAEKIHVSDATWADDSIMFTFDKEPCVLVSC